MKDKLFESYALPKWIEKLSESFANAFIAFIEKRNGNWRNGSVRTIRCGTFSSYANMIVVEFISELETEDDCRGEFDPYEVKVCARNDGKFKYDYLPIRIYVGANYKEVLFSYIAHEFLHSYQYISMYGKNGSDGFMDAQTKYFGEYEEVNEEYDKKLDSIVENIVRMFDMMEVNAHLTTFSALLRTNGNNIRTYQDAKNLIMSSLAYKKYEEAFKTVDDIEKIYEAGKEYELLTVMNLNLGNNFKTPQQCIKWLKERKRKVVEKFEYMIAKICYEFVYSIGM